MKKALITGITGQDGSYLVEFLMQKGRRIWGIIRRSSSFHTGRIDHLYKDPHEATRLRLVYGDLTDDSNLSAIINDIQPDLDVSKAKKNISASRRKPALMKVSKQRLTGIANINPRKQ